MKTPIKEKLFKFFFRIINILKNGFNEVWFFIWDFVEATYNHSITKIYDKLLNSRKFIFNGKMYHYFYHSYNFTWRAERAVEIPIFLNIIRENIGKNILEVGNVMSHYFKFDHDIVDKFEKGNNVVNEDIVDFTSDRKYDLIIAISTIEHVGWDDENRLPFKIIKAIENMKKNLKQNGKIILSFPIGENPFLDIIFKENRIEFSEVYYLKKISLDNKWIQTSREEILKCYYNIPYQFANGLVIGIIKK